MNTSLWIFVLGLCVELGTSARINKPSNDPDLDGSISNETYNKLASLPGQSECGVSGVKTGRIVGGEPAKLGAWPWMAAFGMERYGGYFYFCGATLISNKHAISAAHCVQQFTSVKGLVLRLGDLDLNDEVHDGAKPVTIEIQSFQSHKRYKDALGGFDISLLTLKAPVQFNEFIRPICLPTKAEFYVNDFKGFQPFTAGWGYTKEGGKESSHLMQVQLPLLSSDECSRLFSAFFGTMRLHQDSVCALAEGKDSCQGDSGGPLMFPLNDKYYLYGVVSWGIGCARPNSPGVYNKVHTHAKWIVETLKL